MFWDIFKVEDVPVFVGESYLVYILMWVGESELAYTSVWVRISDEVISVYRAISIGVCTCVVGESKSMYAPT